MQKDWAMPLYIRDKAVDELARRVQRATGAKSKTDAVRLALQHELERATAQMTFDERNAEVMAMADALGTTDPAFDMKAYSDEMWDDR
jgi:antitoxin VapB